jgi:hypothetical protein
MTTHLRSWVLLGCLLLCATAFAEPGSPSPEQSATEDSQNHKVLLETLLAPWKEGESIGVEKWVLDRISQENPANVVIELRSKSEEPIKVRLSKRNDSARNYCTTTNFNLSDSSESSIDGRTSAGQRFALDAICSQLAENDHGQFLLQAKTENNSFQSDFMQWVRSPLFFLGLLGVFFLFYTWISRQPESLAAKCHRWSHRHARHLLYLGFTLTVALWVFSALQTSSTELNIQKYSGNETGLFGTDERQPPLFDLLFVMTGLVSESPFVARMLGLLIWLGAAVFLYRFAKPYFGELRACLITLPVLFSEMVFTHGNPPDLVGLTLLLSLWAMERFFAYQKAPDAKKLFLLSLANMLLVWTSHAGLIICSAQFFLIWTLPMKKKKRLFATTAIAMIFSLLFLLSGLLSNNPITFIHREEGQQIGAFLNLFLPASPALWPALALSVLGILRWRKSGENNALFVLMCSWVFLGAIFIELINRAVGTAPLYLVILLPIVSTAMVLGGLGTSSQHTFSPRQGILLRTLLAGILTHGFFVFYSSI